MRRHSRLAVIGLAALSLAACQDVTSPISPAFSVGSGMPSGKHFTLNIHGGKDKTAAMKAAKATGRGNSIFVSLYFNDANNTGDCWSGNCPVDGLLTSQQNKILLQPGKKFAVLDANATDADGARYSLPQTVSGIYDVYARPLGKPGNGFDEGIATMTTCGPRTIDPDPNVSGDEYEDVLCSLDGYLAIRVNGRPTTDLVTNDLLFVRVNVDGTATDTLSACLAGNHGTGIQAVPLFDGCFENIFWDYDVRGLRLLQLRFYPRAEDDGVGLPESLGG